MLKLFSEAFEDMHKGLVFGVYVIGAVIVHTSEKMVKFITGNK